MFIQEYRASKILFNFLKSNQFNKPFLIPANVCEIVPLTFYTAGIDFDFVDIQEDNLCIDQEIVLNKIQDYQGLIFVRSYGNEDNFLGFFKKVKENNPHCTIIDDACLCMPDYADSPDENVDLKLFSLGYAKQIDMGMGSFAFLNEKWNYQSIHTSFKAGDYENYESEIKLCIKQKKPYSPKIYQFLEYKSFTIDKDHLNESIKRVKSHKQKLNNIYSEYLPKGIQLEKRLQNWRFNIWVGEHKQSKILEALFNNRLFASSHYSPLSSAWNNQSAPVSLRLSETIVNLFNDFHYTEEKAMETCRIINKIYH